MFQAKIRGCARLAAGLLLVPGLAALDIVLLQGLNSIQAQDARPADGGKPGPVDQASAMMKQAKAAFDRGDYDQAADLAHKVKAMNLDLPYFVLPPDELLSEIAAKTGRKPTITVSTPAMPSKATKEDPHLLVKKGRDALDVGHLDDAMRYARQAEINGKGASWGLFEESPSSLIKDVKNAQAKENRKNADKMLAQARHLFEEKAHNDVERAGKLDKARLLAVKSQELHGEYSMWDLGDRPQSLIKEIDATRMKLKLPAKPPERMSAQLNGQQQPVPARDPRALAQNNSQFPPTSQGSTGNVSPYTASNPRNSASPVPSSGPAPFPLDPPPASNEPVKPAVVKNDPILPPPSDLMIPAGGPATASTNPSSIVLPPDLDGKPTEMVPKVDTRKAQAVQFMQQAQACRQREQFAEAKRLLIVAQRQDAVFTNSEETPGAALRALDGAALRKVQFLCHEAHECIVRKDKASLDQAEKDLSDAESIALGMSLDASAIHEHRTMLISAKASLNNSNPNSLLVQAPMQNPKLPVPSVFPPAPPESPGQNVGVQPVAPPTNEPGKALLMQAQVELRAGQLESARRIVTQVFNGPYTCKREAEDLLRTIDAEDYVQRERTARQSYTNAIFAYQDQNYEHAMAIFRQVDPTLLFPYQRNNMAELMGRAEKMAAAKQAQQSNVVRAGGNDPNLPPMSKGAPTITGVPNTSDPRTGPQSLLKQTEAQQQVAFQKLREEELKVESAATQRFGKGETQEAIQDLQNFIDKAKKSELDPAKIALLTRPAETRIERFKVLEHQTQFLVKEARDLRNFKNSMNQEALMKQHKEEEVAALLKTYKQLVAEHRYGDANKVAMQAQAVDPDSPVTNSLVQISKMLYRQDVVSQGHSANEQLNFEQIQKTLELGRSATMENPVLFDRDRWAAISNRQNYGNGFTTMKNRSVTEKEIETALERRMVSFNFSGVPLNEALKTLSLQTKVNIVLDDAALHSKNLPLNTPVNLTLVNNIPLKSALKVLVDQVGLSYIVENDVLKVTTKEGTRGKQTQKTIPVADLVVPVKNYGLPSVYDFEDAIKRSGENRPMLGNSTMPYVPANGLRNSTVASPNSSLGNPVSPSAGPGGSNRLVNVTPPERESDQGTIEQSLIRLITNSVKPDTWAAVGGSGTIEYYPLGMALVINQTPDVIGDVEVLLEQLRRLQDLEIAVEIRVISLSDVFYERIGVDFSMDIQTKHGVNATNAIINGNFAPSTVANGLYQGIKNTVIGLQVPGVPTPDLNLPIAPSSYGLAVPPFGGYQNNPGSNGGLSLGLAFLNDVQVSIFLEAAQGDQRTNIMQAPKLTLFNGGTSTIAIRDIEYFLTNITAVSVNGQLVFQPQNQPVPIGASMTLQAVATGDRRFVRVGIAQSMTNLSSSIVQLFPITTFITPTFEGGFQGQPIPFTQYVQQPQFSTIFVNTTVVVPDGGTVMIGGLKTLQEGRNEFGPPVLSKIPYIDRLFRNVGYGREARSLLMMVTPRIIINREEEFKQTGLGGPEGEGQ